MEWATSSTHHTSSPTLTSTQRTAIHVDTSGAKLCREPEYTDVKTTRE